jgi:hypothetical protein
MSDAPENATAEHVVGEAEKNANEVWRVSLTKFKGHNLANLRGFVIRGRDGSAVNIATKNGVVVRPAQIPALIELLQKAHTEAKARGLIEGARNG